MNYLKIYCNLIRKAENRIPPEGYTEKHHTFPVSIFGKNDRIIVLTAREHYIAHALLERICIQRYGATHRKSKQMTNAHIIMGGRGSYCNSYLYEKVRKRYSNQKKNNKRSQFVRDKISKGMMGRVLSEESRQKISNSLKGKKHTKEHIEKMINSKLLYTYTFISPQNQTFEVINATQFCREQKISRYRMSQVWLGRKKSYSGWKVSRKPRDK